MSRSKTARIKSVAERDVPQSADQVIAAIAEIGQADRERIRIEAAMNDELAAVRQRYELEARPHADLINDNSRRVQLYCEAHRSELTNDGKVKFYRFASGDVKWRTRPPSVNVRGVDAVIESCRALGLKQFLREKTELNKEQILAEPELAKQVRGISISQGEDFLIEPFATELEKVA